MDTKRTKKRPWAKWTIGSLVLLGLAAIGYLVSTSSYASSVTVDRQRVSITPVVEAPFYEYINVTGQFQPRTSFLLDVKVPGTVEQILADEPTGNLDSENSAIVMNKLKYLHGRGSTIVMVTHSRKDA